MAGRPTREIHIFAKGAFDKLLDPDTPLAAEATRLAGRGFYVLAVLHCVRSMEEGVPADRATADAHCVPIGLLLFRNELKPETKGMLAELKAGAIRSVMVTGDSPLTGVHTARDSGMLGAESRVALLHSPAKGELTIEDVQRDGSAGRRVDVPKDTWRSPQAALNALYSGAAAAERRRLAHGRLPQAAVVGQRAHGGCGEWRGGGQGRRRQERRPERRAVGAGDERCGARGADGALPGGDARHVDAVCARVCAHVADGQGDVCQPAHGAPAGDAHVRRRRQRLRRAACGARGHRAQRLRGVDCGAVCGYGGGVHRRGGGGAPRALRAGHVAGRIQVPGDVRHHHEHQQARPVLVLHADVCTLHTRPCAGSLFCVCFVAHRRGQMSWILIDGIIAIGVALTLLLAPPATQLAPVRPTSALIGAATLGGIIAHSLLNLVCTCVGIAIMQSSPHYMPYPVRLNGRSPAEWWKIAHSIEATTIFVLMAAQMLATSLWLGLGGLWRGAFWRNWVHLVVVAALYAVLIALWMAPSNGFQALFDMVTANSVAVDGGLPCRNESDTAVFDRYCKPPGHGHPVGYSHPSGRQRRAERDYGEDCVPRPAVWPDSPRAPVGTPDGVDVMRVHGAGGRGAQKSRRCGVPMCVGIHYSSVRCMA